MRDVLTDEQLGRFLTGRIGATGTEFGRSDGCRCFGGTALDSSDWRRVVNGANEPTWLRHRESRYGVWRSAGSWFEMLCKRFGEECIANALRNRALKLLAQRQGIVGPLPEQRVGLIPNTTNA